MRHTVLIIVVVLLALLNVAFLALTTGSASRTAAPSSEELITRTGGAAVRSVFRIHCPVHKRSGTGFLHTSGRILTAAHVVEHCKPGEVYIIPPVGDQTVAVKIRVNTDTDIALLTPKRKVEGRGLSVGGRTDIPVGAQLLTWGYPDGYRGRAPVLCVGWFSGVDSVNTPSGKPVKRFMVNAAFNRGNSGGPLIDVQTGKVVGMVCSKMAPLPSHIKEGLQALEQQKRGLIAERTRSDGTKEQLSESQLLAEILQYLRSQTQLVIGEAVTRSDLERFLAQSSDSD